VLLWRVVLLVGVIVALVLGGAGLWQGQQPHQTCRYTMVNGAPAKVLGTCRGTQARHQAQLLWYAAAAVGLVSLASMPLLRLRQHR
jgi:hypothetical protein